MTAVLNDRRLKGGRVVGCLTAGKGRQRGRVPIVIGLGPLSLNVPVRSAAVAVAVVQVRVGRGDRRSRRLAARVVRAAGYDAEIAGAQHGALPVVGRRCCQERWRLQVGWQIVRLMVQPGRSVVPEQRPERRQKVLAVRRRVPAVLRANTPHTHTRTRIHTLM